MVRTSMLSFSSALLGLLACSLDASAQQRYGGRPVGGIAGRPAPSGNANVPAGYRVNQTTIGNYGGLGRMQTWDLRGPDGRPVMKLTKPNEVGQPGAGGGMRLPVGGTPSWQGGGSRIVGSPYVPGPSAPLVYPVQQGVPSGNLGNAQVQNAVEPVPEPALRTFGTRYLVVENRSSEKVILLLQYRSLNSEGKYAWVPGEPGQSNTGKRFELEAGKRYNLLDGDFRIHASRVRLLARTESGTVLLDSWKTDHWLVQDDGAGQRSYRAARMETATVTLEDAPEPGGFLGR